jgi:hypothetical protein
MWTSIECAGHPRDMGLAQGGAFANSIRVACEAAGLPLRRSRMPTLEALASGSVRGSGAGREFLRHFAHQAERLEGLARGAKVPADSLLELHLRVREGGTQGGLLSRRACLRAHSAGAASSEKQVLLERTLPAAAPGEVGWVLRESCPAVGFRSIEVGLPWFVPGVAGINEAGLSVMAGPILWGDAGRRGLPPAALLIQECLQRFEDLDSALDWCRKRPVEGEQSVVLADASGGVATVISSGRDRRVQEGEGELYLEGGELPSEGIGDEAKQDRVILDPQTRSLLLAADGTTIEVNLA